MVGVGARKRDRAQFSACEALPSIRGKLSILHLLPICITINYRSGMFCRVHSKNFCLRKWLCAPHVKFALVLKTKKKAQKCGSWKVKLNRNVIRRVWWGEKKSIMNDVQSTFGWWIHSPTDSIARNRKVIWIHYSIPRTSLDNMQPGTVTGRRNAASSFTFYHT